MSLRIVINDMLSAGLICAPKIRVETVFKCIVAGEQLNGSRFHKLIKFTSSIRRNRYETVTDLLRTIKVESEGGG